MPTGGFDFQLGVCSKMHCFSARGVGEQDGQQLSLMPPLCWQSIIVNCGKI